MQWIIKIFPSSARMLSAAAEHCSTRWKKIIHKEHTQSEIIVVVIMLWSKYKDGGRESCLNYIKTYASSPPLLLIWHPHSQPMCMRSPCLQNKEQRGWDGKRKERKKLHENQLRASADDSRIMKKSLVRSVHKLHRISSSSLNPE